MTSWSDLHARLHQQLRSLSLLPPGNPVLIAVSGGQDSVCLGQLLLDLQPRWGWHLAIAHCDHGWEGDGGLADHVAQLAQAWELPFFLCKPERAIAETEAAARQWRYRALADLAMQENFSLIATGHTQTDRAETLLYNLVRGAGTQGLGSLPWRRSLGESVTLVRPLLDITRAETAQFCEAYQLPIWEDGYNQQLKFARNRLRQEVFPQLRLVNPQADRHLAHTAAILEAEADYLQAIAAETLATALSPEKHLHRPTLRPLHLALQRRVLQQFLQQLLPRTPTFQQVETVRNLLSAPNRTQTATFPGNLWIQVQGDWLIPHLP